jgi:hypothetical protein
MLEADDEGRNPPTVVEVLLDTTGAAGAADTDGTTRCCCEGCGRGCARPVGAIGGPAASLSDAALSAAARAALSVRAALPRAAIGAGDSGGTTMVDPAKPAGFPNAVEVGSTALERCGPASSPLAVRWANILVFFLEVPNDCESGKRFASRG